MSEVSVEINVNLRVGPRGTIVNFADVRGVDPADLREGQRVVVMAPVMNLGGTASIRTIDYREKTVALDLDWSGLQPLGGKP